MPLPFFDQPWRRRPQFGLSPYSVPMTPIQQPPQPPMPQPGDGIYRTMPIANPVMRQPVMGQSDADEEEAMRYSRPPRGLVNEAAGRPWDSGNWNWGNKASLRTLLSGAGLLTGLPLGALGMLINSGGPDPLNRGETSSVISGGYPLSAEALAARGPAPGLIQSAPLAAPAPLRPVSNLATAAATKRAQEQEDRQRPAAARKSKASKSKSVANGTPRSGANPKKGY